MSLAQLLNRPVAIVRRTGSVERNEYGTEVAAEGEVETVGELQQRQSAEDGSELSESSWLLILPAGTEVGTSDTILVDGDSYELDGEPWAARNPRTGAESHVECKLRRTAGPSEEDES